MSSERRQHNRINVQWPAKVGKKGLGVSSAQIQDISIGGVFLETTLSIEEGDHVLLEIKATIADEAQRILVEGKIMRKQSRANAIGYGIQFVRIGDDALRQLLQVIATNWTES